MRLQVTSRLLASKRSAYVFHLIFAVLAVISLTHISEKVRIAATLDETNDTLTVAEVEQGSVLTVGDKLVEIDGKYPTSELHLEYLLDRHRDGSSGDMKVLRGNELISLSVPIAPYYDTSYLVSITLSGMIFLFFGLLLLVKRSDDQVAVIAHWLSVTLAATILFTWGSDDRAFIGLLLKMIFIVAYAMAPAMFLRFSTAFPSQLPGWRGSSHRYFFVSGTWIGLCGAIAIILLSRDAITFSTYKLVAVLSNLNFAAGTLLAVSNFFHSYSHAVEEADRRKIRWIILGNAFSVFSYVFLWLTPRVLGYEPLISEGVVILLASVAPITFTIAIIRYRLFDIDRIVNRATVYVMVLGCVLTIYSAVVAFCASLIGQNVAGITTLPSIFAAVIVALCFDPLRGFIQRFVDRKFFRVRYDYQDIVRRINTELEHTFDLASLESLLIRTLRAVFEPERLEVAIGSEYQQVRAEQALNVLNAHWSLAEEGSAAVLLGTGEREVYFIFGLDDGRYYGKMRIGEKRSGKRYSLEDIDLLNAITSASVLALQRIVVTNELMLKNEEARALKELNEMKSLFVSRFTHDLKTPLTSIKMFTEMLDTSYGPDVAAKEYLGIIGGETERLKSLIDNILDYSKIEKGIMRYELEVHDLNEILETVLAKMHYLLEMQHFHVEFEPNKTGVWVAVDRNAIESVFTNLIGNAIKYSADDRRLHVRTVDRDGHAMVTITDHGIGIEHDEIEKIFEPFYRARSNGASQASGSGLGLANVKQIVAAHKGTVTVSSVVGSGSTFELTFPLETAYA